MAGSWSNEENANIDKPSGEGNHDIFEWIAIEMIWAMKRSGSNAEPK